MFNKSTKDHAPTPQGGQGPTPQPAPAPEQSAATASVPPMGQPQQPVAPSAPKPSASVLGADLVIKGGIEGRGEIQLQGRAWGDVKVERLIVGDTAELEGSVDAVTVEVRGRVAGSITARQVRLLPSARVEGDITYEQLAIELGAQFEGKCVRAKANPNQGRVAPPPEKTAAAPTPGPGAVQAGPPPSAEAKPEPKAAQPQPAA